MPTVGTTDAGFSVDLDERARTVRIRTWGFWTAEVSAVFARVVTDTCRGGQLLATVAVDARELKPQRPDGQQALGSMLAGLPALGIRQATITTTNTLTKFQLLRIARERNVLALVQFTAEEPGPALAGDG